MLFGVVLFIAGAVVQLMPPRYPELTILPQQCERAPQLCQTAVQDF